MIKRGPACLEVRTSRPQRLPPFRAARCKKNLAYQAVFRVDPAQTKKPASVDVCKLAVPRKNRINTHPCMMLPLYLGTETCARMSAHEDGDGSDANQPHVGAVLRNCAAVLNVIHSLPGRGAVDTNREKVAASASLQRLGPLYQAVQKKGPAGPAAFRKDDFR